MKILVDTNIILDYLLEREPFFPITEQFFEEIVGGSRVTAYVSASSVTDIFFITQRQTRSYEKARRSVFLMLSLFQVCPVDYPILLEAYDSELSDFEDAVQIACALAGNLDGIVTRNPQDFLTEFIPILSVEGVLERLK
jgi:predicted nucleic acid-binding protein